VQDDIYILQFKWLRYLTTDELLLLPTPFKYGYGIEPEPSSTAPHHTTASFLAQLDYTLWH
jgi:hypothetical protein